MSKNQSPTLGLKSLTATIAVIGMLLFGVAAPASAATPTSISHVSVGLTIRDGLLVGIRQCHSTTAILRMASGSP